jgi:hypothetical protein
VCGDSGQNSPKAAATFAVLEGSPFPTDDSRTIPVDLLLRERALDLWHFIQTAIRHNGPVRITRKLRMGSLIKEIAAIAEKENIDLIVLELRKRFPFADLAVLKLLKMIGRLPCPVLLDAPVDKHARKAKSVLFRFNPIARKPLHSDLDFTR